MCFVFVCEDWTALKAEDYVAQVEGFAPNVG